MDEQAEDPKPKRGWPKGKPRGPRKKNPAPQAPPEPPATPPPPKPFTEPVECTVVYKSGQISTFEASDWEERGDEVRFVSWPEKRGHKVVHYFRRSELAAMSIMAPVEFFDRKKPVQPDVPPPAAAAVLAPPREYVSGDPQISIAPRRPAPNRSTAASVNGVPRTVAKVYDTDGEVHEEAIGASMV